MKKYLYYARCSSGATISIGFYPDTPNKNYRIYYQGCDMGKRYEYLGNAEKELKRVVNAWIENGITEPIFRYATKNEIPIR